MVYPIVTYMLIAVTALLYFASANNPAMKAKLMHYPYEEHRNKDYIRLLTHGFMHADMMHFGINMFVLWMFGDIIETRFLMTFGLLKGRLLFLLLYVATIIAASIPTHFKHKNNPSYRALGASGATSGLVCVFALFNPWEMLYLYFAIPIPAIVFAALYLAYSHWASKNSRDNIGHDAHFWGAIFGFIFTIALNPAYLSNFLTNLVQQAPF